MPKTRRQQKSQVQRSHSRTQDDDDDQAESTTGQWLLDGKSYNTYQDFVNAKRKRNQTKMLDIGLIQAAEELKENVASKKGLASRKRKSERQTLPLPRRKSNRIAGVQADGRYVEHESSGKFFITGEDQTTSSATNREDEPQFFNNRINDGSDITISEAVGLCDAKWADDNAAKRATQFASKSLHLLNKTAQSPTSVVVQDSVASQVDSLAVDDPDFVAKVTPDRIYSVACHPSSESLIVCAGDKQGYVGLWKVDDRSDDNDGVHLFRVHSRPVACLSWTPSGSALISASYDGTVRWFDAGSQVFSQIFATYDDSVTYREHLGRGLDGGYNDWVQYVTPDHRNASEKCFFLSTASGKAMHVDLRIGSGKITFHEELSEKKINTLSLHPDGYSLASAGLDCTVKLWDIRKFGDKRSRSHKSNAAPVATQFAGKSVNSAFFSPSGSRLVSTTMANYLDVTNDFQLSHKTSKPDVKVRHDNHTGRWLATFMAQWHPIQDIFVVGSMMKPRAFDVYDADGTKLRSIQGAALTAVVSRCCFHPSTQKLALVGGNSSGRVTVVR